jgi:hypothetical protein
MMVSSAFLFFVVIATAFFTLAIHTGFAFGVFCASGTFRAICSAYTILARTVLAAAFHFLFLLVISILGDCGSSQETKRQSTD